MQAARVEVTPPSLVAILTRVEHGATVSARAGAIGRSIASKARSSSVAHPDSGDFPRGVAGAVLGCEVCLDPSGRLPVPRTLEYLFYGSGELSGAQACRVQPDRGARGHGAERDVALVAGEWHAKQRHAVG